MVLCKCAIDNYINEQNNNIHVADLLNKFQLHLSLSQ